MPAHAPYRTPVTEAAAWAGMGIAGALLWLWTGLLAPIVRWLADALFGARYPASPLRAAVLCALFASLWVAFVLTVGR